MALDTSIYQNIGNNNLASGLSDVITQQRQLQNAEQDRQNRLAAMAQQQQMGAIQLQQAQQAQSDEQKYRAILQNPENQNPQNTLAALRSAGLHNQAADYLRQQTQAQASQLDLANKRLAGVHQVNAQISSDPQNYQTHIQNGLQSGLILPEDAQHMLQTYQGLPPDKITSYAQSNMADAKDMYDKMNQRPVNPEVKVNDKGEQYTINAKGEVNYVIDPTTGKRMKAQPPAAILAMNAASDPNQIESMAQMIASGRMAAPTGAALRNPATLNLMRRVGEINPDYAAQDFNTTKQALTQFTSGKLGASVRSFNVSLAHLDTLSNLADALNNKDTVAINKIGNYFSAQTGSPAPTNFEAAKKIVSDEIVKAIVGSGGGVADREEAAKTISAASSPEQLKGVINTYKDLMNGQLHGLQRQYEASTGRTDFNRFLSPEALAVSSGQSPSAQATQLSPQDQQAIQWAQANKSDPRAAKILALHGM